MPGCRVNRRSAEPPRQSVTNRESTSSRRIEWLVWGAILVTVVCIAAAFVRSKMDQHDSIDLRPIAQLPDFSLTNQDGHPISLGDLRGNVWVADIIFTQCAGPCP